MRAYRQALIVIVGALLAASYFGLRGGFHFHLDRYAHFSQPIEGLRSGNLETATLAAGCFWCVEEDFDSLTGVLRTTSGYTGGDTVSPTYTEVLSGQTGHAEAVEILYDPLRISYQQLLDHYWKNVDPHEGERQFCDIGKQYRPVIFHHTKQQLELAVTSKAAVESKIGTQVVVQVVAAGPFYAAETHHQNYAEAHPMRYWYYRWTCGRDQRLSELWASDS